MYQKLQSDMKIYMKNKDSVRLSVLRLLLSDIKNESIAAHVDVPSDDLVFKVIVKNIKQREESIKIYRDINNVGLADSEEKELIFLREFMPQQLSDQELEDIVKSEIGKIDNFKVQDMGKIIGNISKDYPNMVEGKRISDVVRKFL